MLTNLLNSLLTKLIYFANSNFPLLRLIALFSFTPSCFLAFLCAPLPARNLPGHIGSDTTAARPPRGGRRWCHCDAPLGGFGYFDSHNFFVVALFLHFRLFWVGGLSFHNTFSTSAVVHCTLSSATATEFTCKFSHECLQILHWANSRATATESTGQE